MPTALITGITGQDGSYLAEFLLERGYDVHGIIRRASDFNTRRIDHLFQDVHTRGAKLHLHYGDLLDSASLKRILSLAEPQEVYNLGAQSHVRVSFDLPVFTVDTVAMGSLRMLEAIRDVNPTIRYYQAGSSEMFGSAGAPQSEETRFEPRSPYACGKVFAHYQTINYREAYGMFAANGILFNHESPRRGETFVTRKVTRAATRIKLGLQDKLYLGNLDARRDWGFAGDFVRAMWLMLQQDKPDDYVIATGTDHSVRDWVEGVFRKLELDTEAHLEFDARYLRPTEVDLLRGDASKARRALDWKPEVDFDQLMDMMIAGDMKLAERERILHDAGHGESPGAEHRP
ncbi:MAG: GDP-mannose 4,6-dehydratase [Planctomycetota bacterium]|nr:GDP-mannose 4,6-dehydratase [Planctomycetota bacterium]